MLISGSQHFQEILWGHFRKEEENYLMVAQGVGLWPRLLKIEFCL